MTPTRPPKSPPPENHRTRVAVERREKTRARLLRGALLVFANHGVDANVIDLVIHEAKVARGTFYNYFRTNEELFFEVAREVSDEIIRIVDPLVQKQSDPGARIACGLISVIKLAMARPILAQFVVRGGPPALTAGNLTTEVVPRDIEAGIRAGRFGITDPQLAFHMIVGPVIMAFHAVIMGTASTEYARNLAQAVLQSLGVSKAQAQKFASQEFGEIEIAEGSLLTQAPFYSKAPR